MLPLATALGCALAAPSVSTKAVPAQLLRRGRPRTAITAANQVLQRRPDDADAMAWIAAGWVATGHPTDAAAAFALSTGSAWYEDVGIDAHGDALRSLQPTSAAALHTERLRMGDLRDARAGPLRHDHPRRFDDQPRGRTERRSDDVVLAPVRAGRHDARDAGCILGDP